MRGSPRFAGERGHHAAGRAKCQSPILIQVEKDRLQAGLAPAQSKDQSGNDGATREESAEDDEKLQPVLPGATVACLPVDPLFPRREAAPGTVIMPDSTLEAGRVGHWGQTLHVKMCHCNWQPPGPTRPRGFGRTREAPCQRHPPAVGGCAITSVHWRFAVNYFSCSTSCCGAGVVVSISLNLGSERSLGAADSLVQQQETALSAIADAQSARRVRIMEVKKLVICLGEGVLALSWWGLLMRGTAAIPAKKPGREITWWERRKRATTGLARHSDSRQRQRQNRLQRRRERLLERISS